MTTNRVIRSLLVILIGLIAFSWWYGWRYSMDVVEGYVVNEPTMTQQILIATQGSEYKNAIVKNVVDRLRSRPIFIKVTDVTMLSQEDPAQWDAILVLHTWEMWKPQPDAEAFVARADKTKIMAVASSGSGEEKLMGVDAISGASVMEDVPNVSEEVISWLENALSGPLNAN